jgi:hypothetical protein
VLGLDERPGLAGEAVPAVGALLVSALLRALERAGAREAAFEPGEVRGTRQVHLRVGLCENEPRVKSTFLVFCPEPVLANDWLSWRKVRPLPHLVREHSWHIHLAGRWTIHRPDRWQRRNPPQPLRAIILNHITSVAYSAFLPNGKRHSGSRRRG